MKYRDTTPPLIGENFAEYAERINRCTACTTVQADRYPDTYEQAFADFETACRAQAAVARAYEKYPETMDVLAQPEPKGAATTTLCIIGAILMVIVMGVLA